MVLCALCFLFLILLPIDFRYWEFALILFGMGASMGLFASPNRASVMNSLPAWARGVGGGMNQTFQNSAQVLSIGIFFTLMTLGLAHSLPSHVFAGLQAHGVSTADAHPRREPAASCSGRSSAMTRCSTCSAPTRWRR